MISFKTKLSTYFCFLVNKLDKWSTHLRQKLKKTPCLLCHATTQSDDQFCRACVSDLPVNKTHCLTCGLPLPVSTPKCGECLTSPPSYHQILAPLIYQYPIDSCIHQGKYKKRRYFFRALTQLLISDIQSRYLATSMPEVILAVPIHKRRRKLRGFNQSELIAQQLSKALHIPTDFLSLRKTVFTETQTKLGKTDRKRNLANSFTLKLKKPYKHVAIAEDIVTTKATIEVICQLLIEQEVERVDIWCLARTPRHR